MAKKEQKIIFTISKTTSGMMNIHMGFYPPMAPSKEAFEKMPMHRREMQNCALEIGKFVMEAMSKSRENPKDEGETVASATQL